MCKHLSQQLYQQRLISGGYRSYNSQNALDLHKRLQGLGISAQTNSTTFASTWKNPSAQTLPLPSNMEV